MAQGTSASHAMPKGIKRVEKGVYRTLDGKVDIRQAKDGWSLWRVGEGDDEPLVEGQKPFKSRGLAVAWLAEHDLLPAEAPKPAEEMTGRELTEVKPELHPGDEQPHPDEPEEPSDEPPGIESAVGQPPRPGTRASRREAAEAAKRVERRPTGRKPRSKAAAKV